MALDAPGKSAGTTRGLQLTLALRTSFQKASLLYNPMRSKTLTPCHISKRMPAS
jgi:hypothetical protein